MAAPDNSQCFDFPKTSSIYPCIEMCDRHSRSSPLACAAIPPRSVLLPGAGELSREVWHSQGNVSGVSIECSHRRDGAAMLPPLQSAHLQLAQSTICPAIASLHGWGRAQKTTVSSIE